MPRKKSTQTEEAPHNGESEGLAERVASEGGEALGAENGERASKAEEAAATSESAQSASAAKSESAAKKAARSGAKSESQTQSKDEGAAQNKPSCGERAQAARQNLAAFFVKAREKAKAGAKKALPCLNKTSDWAWDNAAAVIGIAAAALIGGVFGLIVALLVFAVLNYYRAAGASEKQ
jgi:hypothetical protein